MAPSAGTRSGPREILAALTLALAILDGSQAETQEPPVSAKPARSVDAELARLLEVAGEYVVEYESAFSNLVAEETYTQWVGDRFAAGRARPRITRADLVFVRLAADFFWASFRDVFEVDGHEVRDRDARLEKLFLEPRADAMERVNAILRESAAYNIGSAIRTINLPTLPLAFLHPRNQKRFQFERRGRRRIAGVLGVEVRFVEVARPTLVKGEGSTDLPAKGRFWIAPSRGTVLRSETRFRFEPNRGIASIATEYHPMRELAMWVPAEMTERYESLPNTDSPVFRVPTEARARYSNFRRFGVTVKERAELPEPDSPEPR